MTRNAALAHDLRYAVRLLRPQPRVTALVDATMALGIAAATALFAATLDPLEVLRRN